MKVLNAMIVENVMHATKVMKVMKVMKVRKEGR